MRLFAWFSIRHLRKHPGRAVTVLFGVALGAAVFASVRLSIHASLDSFSRSMTHITGQADWVLTRPGGRLPEELIALVLRQPGVAAASPVLSAYVRSEADPADPFLLIGFDPILDAPLRKWQTDESDRERADAWVTLMGKPFTFIAARSLAEELDWRAGKTVRIEHAENSREFHLAGTMAARDLALAENGRIAVTDIATFQEFTGIFGRVDRIDIRMVPGAGTRSPASGSLRALLPEDVVMQPASQMQESGREMIRAYQLNLSILSFASLFVGMFLVYSLVALNAATRRRELAILRATGASPGMVRMLFLSEGLLFGVLGWMAALPLGSLLVRYLLHGIGQTISTLFVRVVVDKIVLGPWEIGLSFLVTVTVALSAALQPALEAMRVSPREVLAVAWQKPPRRDSPKALALCGLLMTGLVVPLSGLPGPPGIPVPGYAAVVLLFAGFAFMAPLALQRIGTVLSPLLRKTFGMPAYLAARYVRDSGTRTAVSVGALITAVALYISLVIMIHSFRETVRLWVNQTVSGDLFVAARMAEINAFREPLSREVMAILQNLDTQADIVPSRRFMLNHGTFRYQLEGMAMERFMAHGSFVWMHGDPDTVRHELFNGRGVLISEVFANRTGLDIGDLFQARVRSARIRLPVLGVIRDYRTRGGVVFCDISALHRQLPDLRWTGVRFFLRDRNNASETGVMRLRREVLERCGDRLEMVAGQSLRSTVLRIFDETFAVTTVLLLIALAVAALGIATTLTVLVLERTRQLNTLAAVGASPGQVRSMILWEAFLMVTAGQAAGTGCGFLLSHLLIYVINRHSFGWTFLYHVDWVALAWSFPLIGATALAAAIPAIRSAFREPPATLLRER